MTLARSQVLKASGVVGPGVTGVLHWQAGQVAEPLRAWSRQADLGPMGGAAADAAWALVLLLQACTVTDPADPRFDDLHTNVAEARECLRKALDHLDDIADMSDALVRLRGLADR